MIRATPKPPVAPLRRDQCVVCAPLQITYAECEGGHWRLRLDEYERAKALFEKNYGPIVEVEVLPQQTPNRKMSIEVLPQQTPVALSERDSVNSKPLLVLPAAPEPRPPDQRWESRTHRGIISFDRRNEKFGTSVHVRSTGKRAGFYSTLHSAETRGSLIRTLKEKYDEFREVADNGVTASDWLQNLELPKLGRPKKEGFAPIILPPAENLGPRIRRKIRIHQRVFEGLTLAAKANKRSRDDELEAIIRRYLASGGK
jgi:hypothetical protein